MALYDAILFSSGMTGKETSLSLVSMIVILAASLAVTTLKEFGIAQGQGNLTSLTPEQRAAICDPGDKHVNTTESKICGIPKTQPSNATTSSEENTTSPQGIAPPEPPSEG